jgi:hypothetical protein
MRKAGTADRMGMRTKTSQKCGEFERNEFLLKLLLELNVNKAIWAWGVLQDAPLSDASSTCSKF